MNGLTQLVLNLNNLFVAPPLLVNVLTALLFVVAVLSIKKYKYTPSAHIIPQTQYIYTAACVALIVGMGMNRLANFPPVYPLSSLLYVIAFLLFCGNILYSGYKFSCAKKEVLNGNQTNCTTKNSKPHS